jgi:2,3-bisphosphoglycerate-independent phosphoglycerate mutase
LYLAITADHCTPVSLKEHSGDPVPVLIYGPNIVNDDVDSYSERACMKGGLGRIRGLDLLPILINYACKAAKFGE